ncbi:hypothetical protein PIB30_041484 [Stylosanthes scabra]|uniref:Uncharacterized protein n=1 Tax=Stylosanthes scabra TaxID=79078 RepID=A0ABU6SF46_9FABA|nr:hypothetical protein [Stylosanthes scabra]
MSLSSINHQGFSKQVKEEAYSYDQGYTPWNPPPYQHHTPRDDTYQSIRYGMEDTLLSQPLSNQWRSILTLFPYVNQEGSEDALLNEEDVESLDHKEVHECVEEVEEENEDQEAEDIDQEVKDKDKEPKGMEIVHSASSEATPPKLPSELHFEWVIPSNMNFIGPQHYGLLETDDQLRALCGVLDTKGMDSLVLDKSRFITCGKSDFKAYSGHLHKLYNNRAKVRALSMRKHLRPWQF